MLQKTIKIIECPRDAMQGLHDIIPTSRKIDYLNSLLLCGFHTIDFGSFVSPQAVPQLSDTAAVLEGLNPSATSLLAIVANERGFNEALTHKRIRYIGFPYSISETFQLRNTNRTKENARTFIQQMIAKCRERDKELVLYLSMGFGNPYGDPFSFDLVIEEAGFFATAGCEIISVADTIGKATADEIHSGLKKIIEAFPELEIGAHLHATREAAPSRIKAVFDAGCTRIDGALLGYGGCPFAEDQLVGNLPTETILMVADSLGLNHGIQQHPFMDSQILAAKVFPVQ